MSPRPSPTVNVLSPHRDDAALSLGCYLAYLAADGASIRLVSCFTRSEYAPRVGSATVEAVTKLREAEDRHFVSTLGATASLFSLDMFDAPLRPDASVSGPEAVRRHFGPDSAIVAELAQALAKLPPADFWAIPLATGHRDHVATCWAGIAVAGKTALAFYEDVPYSFKHEPDVIARQAADLSARIAMPLAPLDTGFDANIWLRGMACYGSQFSPEECRAMASTLEARGGERIWANHLLSAALGGKFVRE